MKRAQGQEDDRGAKPPRRDVLRNRQRVVEAAAEAFAENGLDAGYDDIARRAGIGVGTVYRRFPERSELIMAVFDTRIDELVDLAVSATRQSDGWSGLCWFLEQLLTVQTRDRGLQELLSSSLLRDKRLAHVQGRLAPAVDALVTRAKAEGTLRPDIESSDIAATTVVLSVIQTDAQPELWRRYLALFLDALVSHRTGATPLPLHAPLEAVVNEMTEEAFQDAELRPHRSHPIR